MLKRLQVRDFKSLRELEVEFGRLTVLVGANGCGKSSVLQAVKLVRDAMLAPPNNDPAIRFSSELLSRPFQGTAPVTSTIRVDISDDHGEFVTEAVLTPFPNGSDSLDYNKSSLKCTPKHGEIDSYEKDLSGSSIPDPLNSIFTRIALYRLDTRFMAGPSYSEQASPVLGLQGENLGAFLDALQGSRREQFEAIEAVLCKFINGLKRVRLRRVAMKVARTVLVGHEWRQVQDNAVGHQVVLDFEFARSISATQASEGTILLLGLLTVIGVEPGPPMTIMLDDLDRALHPKAQRQLVEHLHGLLDQRPELQIIATSHSPYLVEHLAYEEVLAMTQSPVDGRSLIARLDEHPDAERWRDEMSAGEFWSNVGEDWIHQAKAQ